MIDVTGKYVTRDGREVIGLLESEAGACRTGRVDGRWLLWDRDGRHTSSANCKFDSHDLDLVPVSENARSNSPGRARQIISDAMSLRDGTGVSVESLLREARRPGENIDMIHKWKTRGGNGADGG